MLKLKAIVSFFVLVILMPYPGNTPAFAASPDIRARGPQNNDRHFILLEIDKITFLGQTGDVTGNGEFRLLMIGSDTKGHSSGVFCPSDKPILVKPGKTVTDPCLSGFNFDETRVADSVVIMIMALDEDKSTAATDLPYETAVSGLSVALGKAVANYAPKLNPYTFTLQVLLSFAAGKAKSWLEKADIVGAHTLHLTRNNNWSATGTPRKVTSSDGGIEFTYTITRSTSALPGTVVKTPGPQPNPATKTPVVNSTQIPAQNGKTARISCDAGITEVNMRKSPGYLGKDDAVDRVVKVPCGVSVKIIGGPENKDNLTWWHVSWNSYKGWMADHTGKGRVILLFDA